MAWRKQWTGIICLIIFILCGFQTATDTASAQTPAEKPAQIRQFESPISAGKVRRHIEFLASRELKGRSGREARFAADYIKDHFAKLRLKPLFPGGNYFQEIPGTTHGNRKSSDQKNGSRKSSERKIVIGRNVGAWIPGRDPHLRDELIIVSAHYDHLGIRDGQIYRGADDNASGVSMMLEVARQLADAKVKPRRSMVFIGFDLEEQLLWGSRWFAAHPPWPLKRVKLFLTADMIGRSLGGLPLPAVFVLGSEHAPMLKSVLDHVGTPNGLEVARLGIDLIGTRSDYAPFRSRKVPFLFISTGEHPDYHTPQDLPERIDYEKAARVSGLVLKICQEVADADQTPEWTDDLKMDLDEPKAINRITTLLLKIEDDQKFNDLQRFIVSQAQTKTRQIIERGQMTPDERKWLVRMSQLMLLSVF